MNKEDFNLDEMLECAVREKGAREYLQRVEARNRRRRRHWITASFSFAACLVLIAAGGWTIGHKTQVAGYAFDPVAGQMGGSEITALMQEKRIKEALVKIEDAREQLNREIDDPSSTDPDYLIQLEADRQELDLLSAVCAMRQGRYFKARRILKEITRKDGACAVEAQSLLNSF